MEKEKDKVKVYTFKIDFDMCGLCRHDIREILLQSKERREVVIQIKEEDGITHIEIVK